MVLASGWGSVCSAIINFLYSDSIMLNVLKSKVDEMGVDKTGVDEMVQKIQ